jgi:hypothetical protein
MLQMGSRGSQVTKLQGDLNRLLPFEVPPLKLDGIFGPKTRARLVTFQSRNTLRPDGIAGPKTLGRIQQMFAPVGAVPTPGMPMMPPMPLPPPTGAKKFTPEMQKVFQEKGKSDQFDLFLKFLDDLEANKIPGAKNVLGVIGRAEDARQLASFWIEMFEFTRGTPGALSRIFQGVGKLDKNALQLFEAFANPTSKLGKVVKGMGDVASKVGLIVTVIECVQHARRGDPGAIAAELYKFGMGKAVPWAAMVEGVGSLLDGVVPEATRKNSILFKVIRSVDPIGMGAVAVDSVVSIVMGGVEMAVRGKVDVDIMTNRLYPLVNRMKGGPARIFAELGERSGDALYDLCQEGIDFKAIGNHFHYELTSWLEKRRTNRSLGFAF